MSASLELEIKSLLDELGESSSVAERLIPYVEGSEDFFTPDGIVTLCRFLLSTGLYNELIQFVLKHFRKDDFKVPWPYFLEAIALSRPGIDDFLGEVLLEGIESQKARSEASRSKALDLSDAGLKAERADRRLQLMKKHRREKEQLIEQLATLRTQQLFEQERQLLQRLQKMYPNDEDVTREVRDHKERYALEILARHSRFTKALALEQDAPDPETEALKPALSELLIMAATAHPEMAADFAVAAAQWEMWETALNCLGQAPVSPSAQWLYLELLLLAKHHLELLNEIGVMEQEHAADPETFFATAYLRAQALWGLGQKHQAMEVLESLLASRPQYRSGVALLNQWRGPS